jgi:hypothetical protein
MLHSNQLLLKRLEKKITSLGGGELTTDSVDTTHIANGTITAADISNGAITLEKCSPAFQLTLAQVLQSIYNLQYPGFYGTFKFTNDNSSDAGATLTITVESRYYDSVTNTTETSLLITPAETINKNHHYTITIPISERLTNKDTIIRMYYTINKDEIAVENALIFEEDDKTNNYFDFIFDGNYDDNNGGDAEISFKIFDI